MEAGDPCIVMLNGANLVVLLMQLCFTRSGDFYPGAFAHHWHNRYDKGIPVRSWAGILFRRHLKLLREKMC